MPRDKELASMQRMLRAVEAIDLTGDPPAALSIEARLVQRALRASPLELNLAARAIVLIDRELNKQDTPQAAEAVRRFVSERFESRIADKILDASNGADADVAAGGPGHELE